MPPRVFSLDLSRTSYVCQSCLTNLQRPGSQQVLTRSYAHAARKPQPRYPPTPRKLRPARAAAPPAPPPTAQDFQKALLQAQTEDALDLPPETALDDAGRPIDVRYFNEDEAGQYQRLRDGKEFGSASGGLDAEIETAINDLEQQMVNTVQMLKRMEQEGNQDKADELRKQFKKTLREKYKGKTGPEAEEYGLLRIPGFSGMRQRAVANLNRFLARESVVKGGVPKPKDLVECWKFYSAARATLATNWSNVPREAWDFLWMILSFEGAENPNRMRHIYILAKDMRAAGLTLRDSQQLLAIEAMFIEGWKEEAIDAWKKAVVTLGSKPDIFRGYWELGIRMCCLHGDTDRALRAADTLLNSPAQDADPRILIPIIRALATKETAYEQAWDSYQRLRELLGGDMKIEDYDEIIAAFLSSNRVEYGLQSFVDMMFSGAVDIRGRTKLPTQVGNHFFIGKWLKRLIGAGDLDGAYKVVVYLQSRGVVASPIQLNGLIGAWLRSETAENLEKAEKLAWDMIRSRLSYVRLRQREAAMESSIHLYDPGNRITPGAQGDDAAEFVCATRASAETFSLMAENYSVRGLHDRLQELWGVLEAAEIGTTSFIMNQLMRSFTQNAQAQEAVDFYQTMTQERGISPDAHTFLALFNTLSVNRLLQRDTGLAVIDAINGRKHFSDMVHADWSFDSMETFAILPRTVLFSMLKAKDFTGMIIAARAMKELFDFTPPEALLIELAAGTATLRVKTKRNMERIMEGSKTIEALIRRHRREVGHEGGALTPEQKAAELGAVLEQLVLIKAGAQDADPREVRPLLEATARDMGVYDIVIARDPVLISRRKKLVRQDAGDD
ncbi:hypothetical protein B0T22DRAFT_52670 [Podospora appendiculata]|uniref:Pentatricopeptide repeat-containing protein n=1 Tax=Podospora appendiculata TaxID=314037 RepID=A0AAE0XIC2_9PEZI|nr:hypothetical protein B0T22DRAFT_52670 [Podospora appendiculata]